MENEKSSTYRVSAAVKSKAPAFDAGYGGRETKKPFTELMHDTGIYKLYSQFGPVSDFIYGVGIGNEMFNLGNSEDQTRFKRLITLLAEDMRIEQAVVIQALNMVPMQTPGDGTLEDKISLEQALIQTGELYRLIEYLGRYNITSQRVMSAIRTARPIRKNFTFDEIDTAVMKLIDKLRG